MQITTKLKGWMQVAALVAAASLVAACGGGGGDSGSSNSGNDGINSLPAGPTRRVPLGSIAGARSGDKGGSANVGVWVRSDEQWRWLANTLTVELLKELLPEAGDFEVTRHLLPNLRAVNFVIDGILGQGVAYQARFDPQAKGLGEWLRGRYLDIPESLL